MDDHIFMYLFNDQSNNIQYIQICSSKRHIYYYSLQSVQALHALLIAPSAMISIVMFTMMQASLPVDS